DHGADRYFDRVRDLFDESLLDGCNVDRWVREALGGARRHDVLLAITWRRRPAYCSLQRRRCTLPLVVRGNEPGSMSTISNGETPCSARIRLCICAIACSNASRAPCDARTSPTTTSRSRSSCWCWNAATPPGRILGCASAALDSTS